MGSGVDVDGRSHRNGQYGPVCLPVAAGKRGSEEMSLFGTEPLTAAYGRKHMTLEEAQADFNKDKDFQTPSGRYTNRSDLAKMYPHLERIRVRFNELEDTGYVLFKSEPEPASTTDDELLGRLGVPSDEQLSAWMFDGVCEATDGCLVEPDGTCPHGAPSWLIQLGMI